MANRYRDTTIWNEDWYCNLGGEYMLLWDYICDNCDNAGVWKPNKIGFERSTGLKVNLDSFLKKVNGDKKRIIALENGRWFLPGFIKYQWFTKKDSFDLVLSIPHQLNLYNLLKANNINVLSLRGCQGVREGLPTRLVRYINTESINKNNDEVFEENNTDTENTKEKNKKKERKKTIKKTIFPSKEEIETMIIPEEELESCKKLSDNILEKEVTTKNDIIQYWQRFKIINFTGEKPYKTNKEIYNHFKNWLNFQIDKKIKNNNGKYPTNTTTADRKQQQYDQNNELLRAYEDFTKQSFE